MEFKILSSLSQIRSKTREEFYKDKLSIQGFHRLFDSENPQLKDLTFYDKYSKVVEEGGGVEVWGAIKVIPMSDEDPWVDYNYSISTKGTVVSHKQPKVIKPKTYDDGYKYTFLTLKYVNIHRAVMSTFAWDVSTDTPKSDLTINHKNRIRDFNELSNLEWMTLEDNLNDAGKLSPSIKITVVDDKIGIPVGTEYFLARRKDLKEYGISPVRFKERVRNSRQPYGLTIEKGIDPKGKRLGLSNDIVEYLKLKIM